MSEIEVSERQRIAILTMKRPDHGNRITQTMAEELIEALDTIRRNPSILGCVLTGYGDVFCLGGDYQGAGPRIAGRMEFGRAHIDLIDAMARLGKPLVAALNGNAHAGGFSLVVACDLAFVEEGATLGLPEVAHGLFPLLALAIVRDALPKKVLFDIIYNARLLGADEARALHLVNEVVPRGSAVSRSIEAVEAASRGNPDILTIGRDLYYAMRGVSPAEALDKARFALGSALGARDELPPRT
ncbi:MAG: enoyl-CoA hydratase/isomerase family protein [Bradyrhizobium sp.]|uniref:enoyl-CoA hydratase/isomerase family protein n=1 Tax=Bradyrhizobium sp. TaxID=376 RepID=UPI0029BBF2F2|nr:enoyl-CoA hydratase/isomerase family protein [Bradyrhizobium sp.]MDX3969191.1 enoyl-CoA hydratase/isomerase family protein [Bradyrhizobium sp.]